MFDNVRRNITRLVLLCLLGMWVAAIIGMTSLFQEMTNEEVRPYVPAYSAPRSAPAWTSMPLPVYKSTGHAPVAEPSGLAVAPVASAARPLHTSSSAMAQSYGGGVAVGHMSSMSGHNHTARPTQPTDVSTPMLASASIGLHTSLSSLRSGIAASSVRAIAYAPGGPGVPNNPAGPGVPIVPFGPGVPDVETLPCTNCVDLNMDGLCDHCGCDMVSCECGDSFDECGCPLDSTFLAGLPMLLFAGVYAVWKSRERRKNHPAEA